MKSAVLVCQAVTAQRGVHLMPKELKSCGVLVVRGNPPASFLLMQHPDRWDLPKGHVDPGETEVECALRELDEETGIPADAVTLDPGFRFTLQYPVTDPASGVQRLKTLVIFLGRLERDVPISVSEHEGARWFEWSPPHNIQEMTINPLLRSLEQYLDSTQGGKRQPGGPAADSP